MSKNGAEETPPTMIIPRGTEIQVDAQGQLSVRAPGNLVIQHSGHYGNLESVGGSIRIEPNVEVEAVSVRCAETCYVQGSLTAWKVHARCLQLEDAARAQVVLQETERLEVSKGARLVGNFGSEKELFFLFSRFAPQVRSLPFYQRSASGSLPMEPGVEAAASLPAAASAAGEPEAAASGSLDLLSAADPADTQELPDALFFSLVLLERESMSHRLGADGDRVLQELIKLLRGRDLEALRSTYRTLFGRVTEGGDTLGRAQELVDGFFRAHPTASPRPPVELRPPS